MTKKRGQTPSVEIDDRQVAINRATQAANWCVRILREFLVVADAPAGTDESLTCRSAVFENVKGSGFQQQLAEPLWKAAEYVSSESNREAVSQFNGEPDRSLIASVDAWSNSWHDLASHVLTDLAENANRILSREAVIDYRDASEEDLSYFKLTMYDWRVPEGWFDVLFFVKHQWRFRSIRLDQIENGILRENLRTRGTKGAPLAEMASEMDGKADPPGIGSPRSGEREIAQAMLTIRDWFNFEPPPSDWHQEPLSGTQQQICKWLQFKDEETLHKQCRNRDKFWIVKELRTLYHLYFRDKIRFEAAKRRQNESDLSPP